MTTFDSVCEALGNALTGSLRQQAVADAAGAGDLGKALLRLRDGMRTHVWRVRPAPLDLERVVQKYDRKTRAVGFHVLNDWDGIADRVNDDTIAVDVLHYLRDRRGDQPADPIVLAVLLDYYFMHLVALLTLRVWDEGDANANLDRVEALLAALQGPGGSGHVFAANAETLLLIATSHYELHERGYGVLLDQTRSLNRAHQLRVAMGHAVTMGCHLRFGFEATYGRDTTNMRNDNVADYPWLCHAVATLMTEYERLCDEQAPEPDRAVVIEALLNGLSADARALLGRPPAILAAVEDERAAFQRAFGRRRDDLLTAFEAYRPSEVGYSPLAFFFNFSHNVVKGLVIDALLEARPWRVSFNDLLTCRPGGAPPGERAQAAETLMAHARANPHRIRGHLRPVIVYDVQSGREAFSVAMRKMRE
ncbi:MAG: hypothetical protein ACT4QD_06705 [Acidobacteriota bacterium]